MCSKRQRERKPRGKKKVRVIEPIPGSTDIHVHCVYNCGTRYRTARRTVDNKRWHKSLRCVNAHESQRCPLRHSKKSSCASPSHRPRKRARARSAARLRRACSRVVTSDTTFTDAAPSSPRPRNGRQRRSAAVSARRKWRDGIRAAEEQEMEDLERSESDSEEPPLPDVEEQRAQPEPEPSPESSPLPQPQPQVRVKMEPRWLGGAASLEDGFQELRMEEEGGERPMKKEPRIEMVRVSSAQSQQSFDGGIIDIMLLDKRLAENEASIQALRRGGFGEEVTDVTDSLGELKFLSMPDVIAPLCGQPSAAPSTAGPAATVARAAAAVAAGNCAQAAAVQAGTASGAAQCAATEAGSAWSAAAAAAHADATAKAKARAKANAADDAACAPGKLGRQNASLDLGRHLTPCRHSEPSGMDPAAPPRKVDIEAANGMMPMPSMGDRINAAVGRMCPPGA